MDFNGAMAVRPWMADIDPDREARHQNFNGAMAVRPWMGLRAWSAAAA